MKDYSIHARDISHSVVFSGDGNTIHFGSSGLRLNFQRPHDPSPRTGNAGRELDLFNPNTNQLPLVGRADMLADLRRWLDDPADLSAHALIGPAGSGKTRLAIELCRAIDPRQNWRAGFVSATDIQQIVKELVAHDFVWTAPALLVVDYAAIAHQALGEWLDALTRITHTHKLRFLLLEREAPDGFGWWTELTRTSLNHKAGRASLFYAPNPTKAEALLPGPDRHALIQSAYQAAQALRGNPAAPPVPAPGENATFDRLLREPRFGNPLNLVMAGIIACEKDPLGALGLRRLDAALHLANRELDRLADEAAAMGIGQRAIRHIAAFNGLAGGLAEPSLPETLAAELAASGHQADQHELASLLCREFAAAPGAGEPHLSTTQPDLIGEALILRAFEGASFVAAAAAPALRRAYAATGPRAAASLMRLLQDFAYALEDRDAPAPDIKRAKTVMEWLQALAEQTTDPLALIPLVFALPMDTLVLREAAFSLTERVFLSIKKQNAPSELTIEQAPLYAALLGSLSIRLSALGQHEAALDAAQEAETLYRALADARRDAFTPDLATSLNNLAILLSALGQREAALEAAQEAVTLRRALADARPDAFTPNLAGSLSNLANRLSALGQREAALDAAQEAVTLYRALADARPDAFTPDLARSLSVLGDMLERLDRSADAVAHDEEAVRVLSPYFLRLPAAYAGAMRAYAGDYVRRCGLIGREPDAALLGPIAGKTVLF